MSTEWSRIGDPRGAMPKAVSTMEAEYRCDYAYHAQMEPLNAIASVSPAGDAVEIWAGTQSQTTATEAPAKLLGIPKNKVKLHDMLMGRLRPARQPRRRFHHRRGADVEGSPPAGEGDVDA
jgi:isoquinoline 1-oxidoreductase beta subunit